MKQEINTFTNNSKNYIATIARDAVSDSLAAFRVRLRVSRSYGSMKSYYIRNR